MTLALWALDSARSKLFYNLMFFLKLRMESSLSVTTTIFSANSKSSLQSCYYHCCEKQGQRTTVPETSGDFPFYKWQ